MNDGPTAATTGLPAAMRAAVLTSTAALRCSSSAMTWRSRRSVRARC